MCVLVVICHKSDAYSRLFTVAGAAQQAATRTLTFQAAVLSKVRHFIPPCAAWLCLHLFCLARSLSSERRCP